MIQTQTQRSDDATAKNEASVTVSVTNGSEPEYGLPSTNLSHTEQPSTQEENDQKSSDSTVTEDALIAATSRYVDVTRDVQDSITLEAPVVVHHDGGRHDVHGDVGSSIDVQGHVNDSIQESNQQSRSDSSHESAIETKKQLGNSADATHSKTTTSTCIALMLTVILQNLLYQ